MRRLAAISCRSRVFLIVAALLVPGLSCCCSPSIFAPPKGIDEIGGLRLTVKIDTSNLAGGERPGDWTEHIRSVLRQRLHRIGFLGGDAKSLGNDEFEIVVPGAKPADLAKIKQCLAAGTLEFLIVANSSDHPRLIRKALDDLQADEIVDDDGSLGKWVNLFSPHDFSGQDQKLIGANVEDILRVRASEDEFVELKPSELVRAAMEDGSVGELEKALAAEGYRDPQVLVSFAPRGKNIFGRHFKQVSADIDERGKPAIRFQLTEEGGKLMEELTKKNLPNPAKGEYRRMGIVLDDVIVSSPRLMSVIGRDGQISGQFTQEEVDGIVVNFRAGQLPVRFLATPLKEEWVPAK